MKSNNPNSGIYEASASRTIDCNGLNPACNQGGNVVVQNVISTGTGKYSNYGYDIASTICARDYKDPQIVSKSEYEVRRITPLECERLQGFPDNWTTSESDTHRYQALGNSVALPCVDYIINGIVDELTE